MKISLFSIGIIAFTLIGCLGEDTITPSDSSNDTISSMEESSTETNEGSSVQTNDASSQESSEELSSESNDNSSQLSSEESSNESSNEILSSSQSSGGAISLGDIVGKWFFSKVIGGGPNDFLVEIMDDASVTFSLTLLGTVKNSAEGTIEIKDDLILLNWDECKAKKDVVECSDDSASKIPNTLGFDGSAIYDADITDYIYEIK
ncbi:MAG: hypothetical protein OCD01_11140 [Fibrobacterales bacterium]